VLSVRGKPVICALHFSIIGRFATEGKSDCNEPHHFVAARIRAVVPLQLCPIW
jgi:hypothetical protein